MCRKRDRMDRDAMMRYIDILLDDLSQGIELFRRVIADLKKEKDMLVINGYLSSLELEARNLITRIQQARSELIHYLNTQCLNAKKQRECLVKTQMKAIKETKDILSALRTLVELLVKILFYAVFKL